ncbi:MAG: alkaline phosphatase D family protein [Myxococcota bacterium]
MPLSRRELLRRAGLLGAAAFLPRLSGCDDGGGGLPTYSFDGEPGPEDLFRHGVASGDPLTDSVILWTRVSPAEDAPVEVYWEVSADPSLASRVAAGWSTTDGSRDWTVKVDAAGLEPGTTYYYRFRALGRSSISGRTRTTPAEGGEHLRLAVMSCANYAKGYFHAYRKVAERADLDAVVHLGDYIYELENSGYVREHDPPRECVTLDDYRRRYAQHHADPDHAEVHRQHPFIVVWDDHESANDSWRGGAEAHQPETEGSWETRKAEAMQAFSEWVPVRDGAEGRIYRTLRFGDLADLVMLDTRLAGRDLQPASNTPEVLQDPDRDLLGAEQEGWLFEQLRTSTARWRLVGQQVMFAPLFAAGGQQPMNTDSWDGYQAARARVLDVLGEDAVGDTVILSGDVHMSWALEVTGAPHDPQRYDPETGEGAVATEVVTPGVTSPSTPFGLGEALRAELLPDNPHIRWGDMEHRGYMVLDVTPERVQADWFLFDHEAIAAPAPAEERFAAGLSVRHGETRLVEEAAPAPSKSDAPARAEE